MLFLTRIEVLIQEFGLGKSLQRPAQDLDKNFQDLLISYGYQVLVDIRMKLSSLENTCLDLGQVLG